MSKDIIKMKDKDGNVEREYRPAVFLINTKTEKGTPRLCTLIPDTQTIALAGGEEFLIALIPVEMYKEGD